MLRPGSISSSIFDYERSIQDHRSGTVDIGVLQALEDLAVGPLDLTVETGCGKTTILLSNLSRRHLVFAVNDTAEEHSSVRYFRDCPVFVAERTELVEGPTQRTLPSFSFTRPIDLAFLDGPHGYPFPELEYFYVYPHLRTGALLVIDDIHIPTIYQFFRFVAEDEMFELERVERTTAFFRRTASPVFSTVGDGWWLQRYNKSRFPIDLSSGVEPERKAEQEPVQSAAPNDDALTARLRQLESDNSALSEQLAWWQHVAEERRLKRRLERRFPFLAPWLKQGR
jgi:predicted O-methyltransferase YrrM